MKLKILIIMLALMLIVPTGWAKIDVITQAQGGVICQQGSDPTFAYVVGFGVPIVEKSEVGYALKAQTTYLYSDFKIDGQQIQVIRELIVNEKSLWTGEHLSLNIGFGYGIWNFINTNDADSREQAVLLSLGGSWRSLAIDASCEIVTLDDGDLYFPSIRFLLLLPDL